MYNITSDQIAAVLSEIVRERLMEGEVVQVPGLGHFRVEHRPSEVEERPDGQVVMQPPRDVIQFSPSA